MKKVVVTVAIICIALLILLLIIWGCSYSAAQYELEKQKEVWAEINDTALPAQWYQEDGYDEVSEWWASISELKANNANLVSETILALGDHLTEDQVNRLVEIEDAIRDSHSINEINTLVEEATGIIAEAENSKTNAETLKAESMTGGNSGSSNNTVAYSGGSSSYGDASSFKSQGVVYMNGTRYTWYSQNVLPGHGLTSLNNNGRHVENGFVKDADGYIAVASSDHAKGTVVDTPYGAGKVYDSGCASGTIDIYTDY